MSHYFASYAPMDESGIVAWTPFIDKEQVQEAYLNGVFPWPEQDESIFWFSPLERGVLYFKDYKLNKSTAKAFRKKDFEFRVNYDFRSCIEKCAYVKKEVEGDTWITEDLIQTYISLHREGWVYSFETYLEGCLVGAVYGVLHKRYFSAESMFYTESNASKFAFYNMISYLSEKGLSWIDTQMVTPFTANLGAQYISRKKFLSMHKKGII